MTISEEHFEEKKTGSGFKATGILHVLFFFSYADLVKQVTVFKDDYF